MELLDPPLRTFCVMCVCLCVLVCVCVGVCVCLCNCIRAQNFCSLGALWPLTEHFRGTRNVRGTHRKSTCQCGFLIFIFTVLLTHVLIIDAEITMCGFKFSVTFYCESHLYQLFPRVRACVR